MKRAIILSVGEELISGAIVDTNSAWLSGRLMEVGVTTVRHVTVPDDTAAIAQSIREAAGDADVVLITGGLGPTADDLSRDALAAALGVRLQIDERSLRTIEAFFASRQRPMSQSNRIQAMVPAGAEAMANDCGTAPGLAARLGTARVFIMPGVPHEMKQMYDKQVLPRLEFGGHNTELPGSAGPGSSVLCPPNSGCIVHEVVRTFGAGESVIGERIADLMARGRNPRVGTTASGGVISIRILATADTPAAAKALAGRDAQDVRGRLGEIVFGSGEDTLANAVGRALKAAGQTLAVAESCTGGLLGELITTVSGASAYFLGGAVTYANSAKVELLGVPAELVEKLGAVSEPVAAAMAEGARRRLRADWGIGVTGIAGPTGGTPDKPVGLVCIGLAGPGGTTTHRSVFPSHREMVRTRTALTALNLLRLELAKHAG